MIWFHGSSVGEVLSIIPLIQELEKEKKIDQILITSNTLSSKKVLSKIKFKKTISISCLHAFIKNTIRVYIDTNVVYKKKILLRIIVTTVKNL